MVSIDNVYQRVLAIANKEQRGYITPQEFNLLAYKAQMDIFESYFYEYGSRLLSPNISTNVPTDVEMLYEKMLPFRKNEVIKTNSTIQVGSIGGMYYGLNNVAVSGYTLPIDVYYLDNVTNNVMGVGSEVVSSDFWQMLSLTKLRPFSIFKPIFARGPIPNSVINNSFTINAGEENKPPTGSVTELKPSFTGYNLVVAPGSGTQEYGNSGLRVDDYITCNYFRKPVSPKWTYVVVNGKALYNSSALDLQDFELHRSEESALTNKILELAGIVINKPDLSEVVLRNEGVKNAIKNQ